MDYNLIFMRSIMLILNLFQSFPWFASQNCDSILMACFAKKELILTTQLDATHETARLFVDFYEPWDPERIKPEYILMEVHLVTRDIAYYFQIRKGNIVEELVWNMGLYQRLKSLFSDKKNLLIINFDAQSRDICISSDSELKSIRFPMVEKKGITRLDESPVAVMMRLAEKLEIEKQGILAELARKQEQEKLKINEVSTIMRQAKDLAQDDMFQIKNRFLPVINKVKEVLKKRMHFENEDGEDYEQRVKEQERMKKEREREVKGRKVFKIKSDGRERRDEEADEENNNEQNANEDIPADFQSIF